MRGLYYEQFQQLPYVTTLPDPTPSPAGVVLKVEAAGLCRSDWHGWMGHDPDITLPHVPGHELAGTVVAAGRQVERYRGGEDVTVPFVCGCGSCEQCRSGNQQVCERQFQPGFTAWGAFAEYVAIDYADENLVALPESMTFETAASLGCRFVTAFRGVVDQGRVQPGMWVAVHGCGGVGLSAVMIAVAAGARVIAVDINDDALETAVGFGAEVRINGRETQDVPEAIREITGGGAALSLDALGSPTTAVQSILSLRIRGTHIQIGLLLAQEGTPPIPMAPVVSRELRILGSHGMQAHRYPALLGMIQSGRVAADQLFRRRISLDEAGTALAEMNEFRHTGVSIINRF
ncbi:MAG: zinc-dependent alcohol dehydrogenase family protein [Spirochaeta sp.]|nr:zinc-dependent alcohol dehydrogenase family protein [Spirochaeta sp.]